MRCHRNWVAGFRTARFLVAIVVFIGVAGARADEPPAGAAGPNFEDDVVPILEVRCFKCHGDEVRKGGLDLRRKFTAVQGGDGGPAVVPGKPDESLLIEMIESKEMPPKEEDPLDARQIEVLRRWVAAGAPIKGAAEAPLEAADAEGTVSDEDRKFWSFQPPVRLPVPSVKGANSVRTPIDAFLLARLEAQGLTFNSEAPKLTLLRRLCFDLHGLPPTPEQIDVFLADDHDGAYERLVDRLLESPHYGERWARHWLDVAGYTDSDGGLDADRERPEAWRYRDYVIRALNNDKPYDEFVREQIAGDELSDWRHAAELTPEIVDQLVATGFLRTAVDPTYPGYKEKPEIYKVLADTVQIVGSTFLGVTIHCARCHEHKLEPIPQRDYYELAAVFAPALDPDRWLASIERGIPLATDAQQAKIDAHNKATNERIQALEAQNTELMTEHRDKFLNEKLASLSEETRKLVIAALLTVNDKRTDEQKQLVEKHAAGLAFDNNLLLARFPDLKAESGKIQVALAAEKALLKAIVQLRGIRDLDGDPPETKLLRRGDFNNKGRTVEPGVPAVLTSAGFKLAPQPEFKSTGRRKALAAWLTDPRHPMTARLQVNRVWAGHFGKGLVETLDDFGHTGKRPTHPELLDWLAVEFAEPVHCGLRIADCGLGQSQSEIRNPKSAIGPWSLKRLHRLIVTSTAYRQSSTFDAGKSEVDSDNQLLWAYRPQRHQGETLRDAVLAVAGKLNRQMYGVPVPVARQEDGSVITADDANGNRRSVYLQVRRSQPETLMEAFDAPKMEVNCTRRTEAIVATQALTLLNSPFMESSAKALAARIVASGTDRPTRTELAWKLLFSREPTESERRSLTKFLEEYAALQLSAGAGPANPEQKQAAEDAAWQQAALTLLNTNEFLFVD